MVAKVLPLRQTMTVAEAAGAFLAQDLGRDPLHASQTGGVRHR